MYGFGNISSNNILIYDFFIFNNEFDMLEIRLYELYDHVTLFLIAESNQTFSGKSKPLYLKDNWSRFSRYHNKIRRVEVNFMILNQKTTDAWSRERRMRDEGIRLALPHSTKDYLLLTSDLDEIPKSRFVQALASCELRTPFQPMLLQCDFYYYSFEFRHATRPYSDGGTVSKFSPNTAVPSDLRKARFRYRSMPSTCFHCSSCFDRLASVRLKIASFSHTEFDIPKFRDQNHIIDRFRNGKDLFDRVGERYRRTYPHETGLPKLLRVEPKRFLYMLNRSSPNAGFRDV
ncbi:unnamed protein product [Rotaria socialis]|uniref:Uncharacterized protein n=1 Tax=Rotaria socialis TaxID=392032 RepID=A0A820KZM0_9BILA|nr:unnamed protein product [Rotaria socialis]CAF4351022.1 unnamed protein product [Rotaria socialis]